MANPLKTEIIATRVEPEIVRLLDEMAEAQGFSRSDLLRILIRKELARLSLLPVAKQNLLGMGNVEVPPALEEKGVDKL